MRRQVSRSEKSAPFFPFTDAQGFVHLSVHVVLDYFWDEIKAAVEAASWEAGDDRWTLRRGIYLGFMPWPSGKMYAPWATGNLEGCPRCHGTGHLYKVDRAKAEDVLARVARLQERMRRHRDAPYMRALWGKALAMERAVRRDCPRCGGLGCAEAHDDELWREGMEAKLATYGLSLTQSEGDPCDALVEQCRDRGVSEMNTEDSREEVEKAVEAAWPEAVYELTFGDVRWRVTVVDPGTSPEDYEVHDDEATGDLVFVEA